MMHLLEHPFYNQQRNRLYFVTCFDAVLYK